MTSLLGIAAFTAFVILPWRREGQLTTTGMLYLCWLTLFFQDPMMSYSSASLLYNSYMVNLGTWTLGATPGWMSPHGNNVPEPLLLIVVGYTSIGYSLCFPVIAMLRKISGAFPAIGKYSLVAIGILILIALDTVFESLLLRTGVYAYPGAIRAITLFTGHTYQFPMSEGLCYGGLTTGSTMALLLYRDDRSQTFVERGLDRLAVSGVRRQGIKFLALFGFVHVSMFMVFTIPMQWLALHSDPFPKGYPSYMTNGLCAYGAHGDECPGPGVLMPARSVTRPRAPAVSAVLERIRHAYERDVASGQEARTAEDLPLSFEAITDRWLTAVLCSAVPGAAVTGHRLSAPDNGSSNRRKIYLDFNDAGRDAGLPDAVFCKASRGLANRVILGLAGGAHAEAAFYNDIRPLLDVEAPAGYFARVDAETYNSMIMLEDPTESVTAFCNDMTLMTRARAESQLRLLGRVHGACYGDAALRSRLSKFGTWKEYFTQTPGFGMREGSNARFLGART